MRTMVSLAIAGAVIFVVGIIGFYSAETFSTEYNIAATLLISGFIATLTSSVSILFFYEKK